MKNFCSNNYMILGLFLLIVLIGGGFQKLDAAWDHLAHIEFRGEDIQHDHEKAVEKMAANPSNPVDTAKDVRESKEWQQDWQDKQNARADTLHAQKVEERKAHKEWQREQNNSGSGSGYNEVMDHGSKVSDGGSSI